MMANTHTCEVKDCDRKATTDVATYDREGTASVMVVCRPCSNAWRIGTHYANEEPNPHD